ncbi:MAG: hypothetical protein ACRD01_06950, partial [Terriglobales bacterium]
MGELRDILPASRQSQEVWGVVDHETRLIDIEAGIGIGVTNASDSRESRRLHCGQNRREGPRNANGVK